MHTHLPGFLYEAVADEHRCVDARQRATVRRRRRRSVVLLLLTQRLTERVVGQLECRRIVVVIVLQVRRQPCSHTPKHHKC